MDCDINVAVTRNVHGWKEEDLRKLTAQWEGIPDHFNKLDLRGFLQDKEITQVEMEDAEIEAIAETVTKDSDEDEVRFLITKKTDFAVIID